MRQDRGPGWLFGLGITLFGCMGPAPGPACPFTGDGVCDEPRNCPLGSDEADCSAVCAQDPDLAPIACSFRGAPGPPSAPALSGSVGSGGSGGPTGTWQGNIEANGPQILPDGGYAQITRYFMLYVPASYDPSRPTPLLYAMGGNQVSMYTWESFTDLMRTADQNGFIVGFLEADWRPLPSPFPLNQLNWVWYVYAFGFPWEDGGGEWSLPPGTTLGSALDWAADPDVSFVQVLTGRLAAQYNLDETRVFVSGHSRGAALAVILAYELPSLIAGYCEQSGFASPSQNDFTPQMTAYAGSRKIPAVIVHGEADGDVPFSESVAIADTLSAAGYIAGQDFLYYPLPGVTHHWQSWLNQQVWDFLAARPLPPSCATENVATAPCIETP